MSGPPASERPTDLAAEVDQALCTGLIAAALSRNCGDLFSSVYLVEDDERHFTGEIAVVPIAGHQRFVVKVCPLDVDEDQAPAP